MKQPFVSSFLSGFRTAFIWTLKTVRVLICFAVASMCLLLVVQPDAVLVRGGTKIFHQPPKPNLDTTPIRIGLGIAAFIVWGLRGKENHEAKALELKKKLHAETKKRLVVEQQREEAKEHLYAKDAELAASNQWREAAVKDFELILSSPAVRRAVLNAWHPDKAKSDNARLHYTEVFKVADRIFKDLAVEEKG
ncbi:MAG: hypothetical protein ABI612_20250 [Betaproteobacteria bacterium]